MAALPTTFPGTRRHPSARPALRLVTGGEPSTRRSASPVAYAPIGREAAPRPRPVAQGSGRAATSLHSARSEHSSPTRALSSAPARHRRHGLLPACATFALLLATWFGAGALRGGAPVPAHLAGSTVSGRAVVYVVRPGDTLWSIATRLEPDADPRPLVNALQAETSDGTLVVGETLHLP